MLIHGKLERTTANGPGVRAAIWFQGCTLNCGGCHNPQTHSFDASKDVSFDAMTTWIQNLPEDVTGITFSGGEPVQHAIALRGLCLYIREIRPAYSIGIFTGYTLPELEAGRFHWLAPELGFVPGNGQIWADLRGLLDWAVMGRFNASKMTTGKPLCGSSNQDVFLFSERHTAADFQPQEVNVTISADGLVSITGFPGVEFINRMGR